MYMTNPSLFIISPIPRYDFLPLLTNVLVLQRSTGTGAVGSPGRSVLRLVEERAVGFASATTRLPLVEVTRAKATTRSRKTAAKTVQVRPVPHQSDFLQSLPRHCDVTQEPEACVRSGVELNQRGCMWLRELTPIQHNVDRCSCALAGFGMLTPLSGYGMH